tara:strand:- start:4015 stop:4521 length:507 start_codon:yes stop_codon:yes gene_type:complete
MVFELENYLLKSDIIKNMKKATFAAGCFWHVEEVFSKTPGVKSTQVGYTGGDLENPTYEQVCTDTTGHAEAIEVEYEPEEISYKELLKVFFENHNPTTSNRQGPDVGIQYRSAIFCHDTNQEKLAKEVKEKLNPIAKEKFGNEIVTEIKSAVQFYRAEEYHQKYFQKH